MERTVLEQYTHTASHSAKVVINQYSTSFSLACRLLDGVSRTHIANIYALVRLADEVVDGVAVEAGLDPAEVAQALDRLETETEAALRTGYSTNLIVHAFVTTARATDIDAALTRPFFASMRADLTQSTHDEKSLEHYIYGSAEVVGLMCLQVFRRMPGAAPDPAEIASAAARRLGAAFQKVNFLRDLAADSTGLGRTYLPGYHQQSFDEAAKQELVKDIRADLQAALAGLPYLPPRAAQAVRMAHGLFSALTDQLEAAAASELLQRRISVSNAHKALIAARTFFPASRRSKA